MHSNSRNPQVKLNSTDGVLKIIKNKLGKETTVEIYWLIGIEKEYLVQISDWVSHWLELICGGIWSTRFTEGCVL